MIDINLPSLQKLKAENVPLRAVIVIVIKETRAWTYSYGIVRSHSTRHRHVRHNVGFGGTALARALNLNSHKRVKLMAQFTGNAKSRQNNMAKKRRPNKTKPKARAKSKGNPSTPTSNVNVTPNEPLMSFFKHPAPFASVPKTDLLKALIDNTDKYAADFAHDLSEIKQLIRQTNPLALLAMASYSALCRPVELLGAQRDEERDVFQSHIELLQALVLMEGPGNFTPQFIVPDKLARITDSLKRLSDNSARTRLMQLALREATEARPESGIIEQFRLHTQDVRNIGYLGQMQQTYRELVKPLDDCFQNAFGATGSAIVDCFTRLSEQSDDRKNQYMRQLEVALSKSTAKDAAIAFTDTFDLPEEDRARVIKDAEESNVTLDECSARMIWTALNGIHRTSVWTISELSTLLNTDIASTTKLIDFWSYRVGDLETFDVQHLFLGNPIWDKPLIKLHGELVFIPVAYFLTTHMLRLIENLVETNSEIKQKFEVRKGKYLEESTVDRLRRVMPAAQFHLGTEWNNSAAGKQGENDILVVADRIGLVIEAKSHRVTDPAKRGAIGRIREKINELVVKPANQAHNFISYLKTQHGVVRLPSSQGGENEIDLTEIDEFLPIAVTFEPLASEGVCWKILAKAGLVPEDLRPVHSLSFWDLDIICEILDSEMLLLHYLHRRLSMERNVTYTGDELDLLVTYLETGLELPKGVKQGVLSIMDLTSRLHPYFMSREKGVSVKKPERRLTPWWGSLVKKVGRKQLTILTFPRNSRRAQGASYCSSKEIAQWQRGSSILSSSRRPSGSSKSRDIR